MANKNNKHYVNNKELLQNIKEYQDGVREAEDSGKEIPVVADKLAIQIMLICERMSLRSNMRNYKFRDDMVADAIIDCLKSIVKFDVERYDNAFGYFTQVAFNAMIRRITKEKKQLIIKNTLIERNNILQDKVVTIDGEQYDIKINQSGSVLDYMDDQI